MKSSLVLLSLFAPVVFSAEFLVGVGKDETTGKKGMGFDPSSIHPTTGDVIAFEFQAGDHSVVEGTFEHPCTPKAGGFNSGVVTVDNSQPVDAAGLPQIRLTVNSTDPIWYFDQAGGLCQKGGVLSVNPTAEQGVAQFLDNAAKDGDAPPPDSPSSPSSPPSSSSGSKPSVSAPGPSGSSTGSGAPAGPSQSGNAASNVAIPGVAVLLASLLGFL